MFNADQAINKWKSVLEHDGTPGITDPYRKAVTAVLLENQEKAQREEAAQNSGNGFLTEAGNTNAQGSATYTDPVLISLVRRAMPQLLAYDIAGVQPMTGPTGLVFAMKSRYGQPDSAGTDIAISSTDSEALFNSIDAAHAGTGTPTAGTGNATADAEGNITANMGFSIEKTTVTAKTRALKAEYTMELAQDLKAVHGLDAESELANILSQEILTEINREVIYQIDNAAETGAADGSVAGVFNLVADGDGRWAVERFQSLLFQIEKEANAITAGTRRGKGNWAVVHSDVASALSATGRLDTSGVGGLNTDFAATTYAGNVGQMKVYVDPFATTGLVIVGYRGSNPYDAGFFYAPYVPLTMVKAVNEESFQPRIAFKTRYGVAHNPIVDAVSTDGTVAADSNPYFRRFIVEAINDIS
jgi:hypothetical protein